MTEYLRRLAKPYRKDPSGLSAKRKVDAYKELTARLKTILPVRSYKDYFAGIGLGAGVVMDTWRESLDRVVLQEVDAKCLSVLAKKFPGAEVNNSDFFDDRDGRYYDLVSLDFNVFTLLSLRRTPSLSESLRRVLDKCRFAFLTDSSRSKFHLNSSSYGVDRWEEYLTELAKETKTDLVSVVDQWEAAYLLLKTTRDPREKKNPGEPPRGSDKTRRRV